MIGDCSLCSTTFYTFYTSLCTSLYYWLFVSPHILSCAIQFELSFPRLQRSTNINNF
ncbi:uncharacterized protein ASCRUDRAFT_78101 [Ascoidea rubescens DSM 1968]|uniref:Uncharacterized protein n=1 Tax=Ascoidea rubescens DSM 1968 TaxID=1344418 RepID=A0A1D2V976_9ASCO|nr:hypothetical protein ASCRUDRAFT_78101 [Ascoidea rubescens DSM 1968]ODV58200.1 hypothetical protein ASCRUDRAFT_78101 [Ascoidea rubescens DSM 1968]